MQYNVEIALGSKEVTDFLKVESHIPTIEVINIMSSLNKDYAIVLENQKPIGIFSESDALRIKYEDKDLNVSVKEYASKPIISVKKNHNLFEAINLMIENDISKLVIVDHEDLALGVITQKSLIKIIDQEMLRRNKYVKDIIKPKELITVSPLDILDEALKKLTKYKIKALVVVEKEEAVGIITQKDFLKLISNDVDLKNNIIRDYMKSPVITCTLDTSLVLASKMMNDFNIRRLIVIDELRKPIGVITQGDIIRNLEGNYEDYIEKKLKNIRQMLDIMQDPVLELMDVGPYNESSGVIIWQNSSAKNTFGGLLGKHITDIIDKYTWSMLYENLRSNKSINYEPIFLNENIYQVSCVYLEDDYKIISGRIKVLFKNITKIYKSDLELRRINRQYQSILDAMDDMVIIYDAKDYTIKITNRAVSEKLGYDVDELTNKNFFDIVLNSENVIKHFIERIIIENKKVVGRRVYIKKNGELLPVHVVATKVYFENHTKKEHILVVARDISKELIIEEKLKKTNKQLNMLYSFITDLSKAHEEDEVYEILIHYLRKLGIEYIHMYKLNPSLNRITSSYLLKAENLYLEHKNGSLVWEDDCLEQDPSFCKVIKSGTNLVVSNVATEYGCPRAKIGKDTKSYMCVPIFVGGGYITNATAILSLISTKQDFFDEQIKLKINKLVEAFVPFLSNIRLIRINRELSIRDPLTDAYNRRFLDEILNKEFQKAIRLKSKLSFIMFDVDSFKAFNDKYGHKAGDIALQVLSNVVREKIRASDVFARYGGEEFAIVLPETSKKDAIDIANRIRTSLSNKIFEIPSTDGAYKTVSISASFGVATFNDDANDLEGLMKISDERLYKAKKLGKNKVIGE